MSSCKENLSTIHIFITISTIVVLMALIIDLLHDPIIYDLNITDSVKEVKS